MRQNPLYLLLFEFDRKGTFVDPHWESHFAESEGDSSYGIFWGEQVDMNGIDDK